MDNQYFERCLGCGLILLRGSVIEVAEQRIAFGAILGLSSDAVAANAIAGYLGPGSRLAAGQTLDGDLHLCPRCRLPCRLDQDQDQDRDARREDDCE